MNHERGENDVDRDRSTICLDIHDLTAVLNTVGLDVFVDGLIAEMSTAIRSLDDTRVEHLPRDGFSYMSPRVGLVEWMPSMIAGDVVAIKTVAYHPDNPLAEQLPSVLGTTSVYDATTGRLVAVCEATLLTAIRTGVASAIMTDALVRPGPITLGVVGCGAQSVAQIHAISRVRPVDRLIVADTDPSIARTLERRLPAGALADGCEPVVLDVMAFQDVVPELDVLCTCTSVEVDKGPVVDLTGAKPSLHVNAVGADFAGKIELPVEYLRTAVVVPDMREQCLLEGESQQLSPSEVGPDMIQVLTDPASKELVNRRTVFDSTGWSYEDLVAAKLFMDHAERLKVGTRLQLQNVTVDPYDPFEAINSADQ